MIKKTPLEENQKLQLKEIERHGWHKEGFETAYDTFHYFAEKVTNSRFQLYLFTLFTPFTWATPKTEILLIIPKPRNIVWQFIQNFNELYKFEPVR